MCEDTYQEDQHLHLRKIFIWASDQKYVYCFLLKGMKFKWPGVWKQQGNKKKSLNKIDYNQLHSLIQDDKWSDFSERSLVKVNFKIFNSGPKKIFNWKPKLYRALNNKSLLTCFLLLSPINIYMCVYVCVCVYKLHLSQEKISDFFLAMPNGPKKWDLSLHLAYTDKQQSTCIVPVKNQRLAKKYTAAVRKSHHSAQNRVE